MKLCKLKGCGLKHEARGYCQQHYKRFMLHGDPLHVARAPNGNGWLSAKGHKYHTVNGHKVLEHRAVAERALGRQLPPGAVVHHIDENRLNNAPANLVICRSAGYHRQIHARMDAIKECGHANWPRCPFCHKHDDPANMRKEKVRYVHATCSADYQKRRLSRVRIQARN